VCSLHRTNAEVVDATLQSERRRRISVRRRRPVVLIDSLLEDLEGLHLCGRKRVPASWESRLRAVSAAVPPACRQDLRTRIKIINLMDRLYEMQEKLLLRQSRFTVVEDITDRKAAGDCHPCVAAPDDDADEEATRPLFKSA